MNALTSAFAQSPSNISPPDAPAEDKATSPFASHADPRVTPGSREELLVLFRLTSRGELAQVIDPDETKRQLPEPTSWFASGETHTNFISEHDQGFGGLVIKIDPETHNWVAPFASLAQLGGDLRIQAWNSENSLGEEDTGGEGIPDVTFVYPAKKFQAAAARLNRHQTTLPEEARAFYRVLRREVGLTPKTPDAVATFKAGIAHSVRFGLAQD